MRAETIAPAQEQKTIAKERGIKILKVYGAIYALVIIFYFVHVFTGSKEVEAENITSGMRNWNVLIFYYKGERIELESGTVLSPATVAAFQARERAGDMPKVKVYKDGFLHGLPWADMLGIWNFLGLVILLYTGLGDILPKILDDYGKTLELDLAEAAKAVKKADELKLAREELTVELKSEEEKLKKKAREEAALEKTTMVEQAYDDAKRMREAFARHLEADVQVATDKLKAELAGKVIADARQALTQADNSHKHQDLVTNFVLQLKETSL